RPHFDPRLIQGAKEEGDTAVARLLVAGAAEDKDVVGILTPGGPGFLTVDDPLVTIKDRSGSQGGEIGTRTGLRVALTPRVLSGDDPGKIVALLLFCPPVEKGVADQTNAETVARNPGRRLRQSELLGHDHLFER